MLKMSRMSGNGEDAVANSIGCTLQSICYLVFASKIG
jgi:hypothetical protein